MFAIIPAQHVPIAVPFIWKKYKSPNINAFNLSTISSNSKSKSLEKQVSEESINLSMYFMTVKLQSLVSIFGYVVIVLDDRSLVFV